MTDKKLKILVVDDTDANIGLLEKFIINRGHEPIVAVNGLEGVEKFTAYQPDLVLMDVMMPEMDGYQATERIRSLSGDQWVPIIFMSAKISVEDQVKGLEVGGDDYLTKPVNLKILDAKIKAMQRIAEMRHALAEQAKELSRYREAAEQEKATAKDLMAYMTSSDTLSGNMLESWVLPAEHMNGDLVAATQTGDGRLYAMVADATGHGLLAAMMQLPVSQVFYGMTREGYSLSSIVTAMNRQLRSLVPRDRFVAATLVMVDQRNQFLEIWNGGSPNAMFITAEGKIEKRFVSKAQPLGVMGEKDFNSHTQVYQWTAPGELLMYSDGATDALDAQGQAFGEERLEESLTRGVKGSCQALADAITDHLQGKPGQDDISIISIKCPVNNAE
jgi:DNA-binding response OmpR family regulator